MTLLTAAEAATIRATADDEQLAAALTPVRDRWVADALDAMADRMATTGWADPERYVRMVAADWRTGAWQGRAR